MTGAGISAESGIPTYRGKGGLWEQIDFEEWATRRAFDADRDRIWSWYDERRRAVREASPNAGHRSIARLAALAREILVITQNVDDLHERAGLPAEQLVHVHGLLLESRCLDCGKQFPARSDDPSRRCEACSVGALRPAVVWFDEELPREPVARIESFLSAGECDLVLVVGTTASFDYIRDWIRRAAGTKGCVVVVDPAESGAVSDLGARTIRVREGAAVALPDLVEAVERVGRTS